MGYRKSSVCNVCSVGRGGGFVDCFLASLPECLVSKSFSLRYHTLLSVLEQYCASTTAHNLLPLPVAACFKDTEPTLMLTKLHDICQLEIFVYNIFLFFLSYFPLFIYVHIMYKQYFFSEII
jgi:hypothetical protein